jgi:dissimilatory sulfite reductase related protein
LARTGKIRDVPGQADFWVTEAIRLDPAVSAGGGPRMPNLTHGDLCIEVDDDGFMADPSLWNEQAALALASTEGLDALTDDHWTIMNYIREYHAQFGVAPMVRKLCKETGFKLKEIYTLFPSGPARGACKVAGLEKPTGCV